MYNIRGYIYLYTTKLKFNSSYLYNFNPNQLEMSLQQMTLHKRLKRKNEDGIEGGEIENNQSVDEAAKLMSLLHRYARENLLLANIYIKVRINILTKNRYSNNFLNRTFWSKRNLLLVKYFRIPLLKS